MSIRFTAIAAWIPIGLIISWKKKTWKDTFNYLVYTCALSGILGILFCTLIDWYFYGFWTIPFLGSFHFNVLLGKKQNKHYFSRLSIFMYLICISSLHLFRARVTLWGPSMALVFIEWFTSDQWIIASIFLIWGVLDNSR